MEFEAQARAFVAKCVEEELRKQALLQLAKHRLAERGLREKDTRLEPTWTDSKGRTQRLKDMPGPHLSNIYNGLLYYGGRIPEHRKHFTGVFNAVREELVRRANA